MLSVKAKETPWLPDQPLGVAQTPLEPASPVTQPVSCRSAMQDWHTPNTGIAPAQDSERLKDTAFSGEAVNPLQVMMQRLDSDNAAPKATNATQGCSVAESLLSAGQTCDSNSVLTAASRFAYRLPPRFLAMQGSFNMWVCVQALNQRGGVGRS